MSARGFILQPTYRIEARRPVVHLFGRLEDGGTFLVRDDRAVPHFYIRERDRARAAALGVEGEATELRTMDGEPVLRVDLRIPADTPPVRDRLHAAGVPCYEADVRFAMRYLIARGVRGALEIEGDWEPGGRIDRVYRNPEIRPARWTPSLSVLSFDIETDPRARRLLSIGLYGCGAAEVLLFTPADYPTPDGALPFATERDLLRAFCARVRELDPDVLTGWNVVDFDFRVLERLARQLGVELDLARGSGRVRLRESRMPWSTWEALVPGRVVLDGIHLLRGSFVRMESYGLDAVAREVLGEGKTSFGRGDDATAAGDDDSTTADNTTMSDAGDPATPLDRVADGGETTLDGAERPNRALEILRAFRGDREAFVDYNLTDARLALEILERLHLVELAVERSLLTGMPIDRVSGAIASFDFLYMSELMKRGVVAPSVAAARARREGSAGGEENGEDAEVDLGGYVIEPEPGLYDNVLVLDFKSLYPSLIRTFHIDPLGYLPDPGGAEDPIVAPNGAAFRRRPGILTQLLDRLFPAREAAKAAGDKVASHAIKILMNSFYGVLGTSACRFYRPPVAAAITSFGRQILLWSKERIESYGYRVLYGDTDSLFVLSGEAEGDAARGLGARLTERLNREVARYVEETWRVESRLELELEHLYRQLLLPAVRHGQGGARKRYVGQLDDGEVVFTGMEVVRRDWTELAKRVQRELYQRLFDDQDLEQYLSMVVHNLRQGRLDGLLVYRKGLGKALDEYTSTTPPHVAAARKMKRKPGRVVSYVMTRNGAEPAGEIKSAIDYEHYVQKQVRPVAEPVLAILGRDFDKVIGDDAQLELF